MKIALYTTNFGGIDDVIKPQQQNIPVDYFCFDENNMPYPLPNLNNRLKGLYVRTQIHYILPNYYDILIWIDGSTEITADDFVSKLRDKLSGCDMVTLKHPDRETVYKEIDFIISELERGDQYLTPRYEDQPFKKEREFYIKEGLPKDYPIFANRIIARHNTVQMNNAFDRWWAGNLQFTNLGQAFMSYVCWKYGLNVKVLKFNDLPFMLWQHAKNV